MYLGTVSEWGAWGACSATCVAEPNNRPFRSRSRTCEGSSFGGNCNGASLTQTERCNNIACQGKCRVQNNNERSL